MKIIIPICTALCISLPASASGLLLAQEYKNQEIAGWAMSEKLDGVRAYWDGKRLIIRLPRQQAIRPIFHPIPYTANFTLRAAVSSRFPPPSVRTKATGAVSNSMFSTYPKPQATFTNASPYCKAGWKPTPKPPSPSYAKFPPATAPTLKPS